ncbi:MAG: D-glycero-beta-D-manno-heptose 1,7-bisphosphate 7-phosphatase [Planctomycetes bacterium]|nr:D-glycero-beta-D-manno-heptose 1,7-bisphosphate 7-phosphatase [Planctomycetota bacterium]
MGRPWILLDRDGTLIVERHYLADPAEVELVAGAGDALRRLRELGCGIVLVTNQSGVGRGRFSLAQLAAVHQRLESLLAAEGAALDGVFFCPHVSEDRCTCRKPAPGLARQAAERFQIDLAASFVIGDKALDIEFGQGIGATTVLVRTGYGAETEREGAARPDVVVDDLPAAVVEIERVLAARGK